MDDHTENQNTSQNTPSIAPLAPPQQTPSDKPKKYGLYLKIIFVAIVLLIFISFPILTFKYLFSRHVKILYTASCGNYSIQLRSTYIPLASEAGSEFFYSVYRITPGSPDQMVAESSGQWSVPLPPPGEYPIVQFQNPPPSYTWDNISYQQGHFFNIIIDPNIFSLDDYKSMASCVTDNIAQFNSKLNDPKYQVKIGGIGYFTSDQQDKYWEEMTKAPAKPIN